MHKSCPHLFPTSAAVQVQVCLSACSFPPGPAAFLCTAQTLHKARLLFQQSLTRSSHAKTHVHSHSRKTRIDSLPCLIAPHPLSLTPSPCRRCIAPILVENKLAQHGNVSREEKRACRLPSPGMQRRCVPLKRPLACLLIHPVSMRPFDAEDTRGCREEGQRERNPGHNRYPRAKTPPKKTELNDCVKSGQNTSSSLLTAREKSTQQPDVFHFNDNCSSAHDTAAYPPFADNWRSLSRSGSCRLPSAAMEIMKSEQSAADRLPRGCSEAELLSAAATAEADVLLGGGARAPTPQLFTETFRTKDPLLEARRRREKRRKNRRVNAALPHVYSLTFPPKLQ